MNRKVMSVMFVVAMTLACGLQAVQAGTWNAYDDFNGLSNTSSNQWQYLYTATAGQNADYQLLDTYSSANGWYRSSDTYSLPFVKTDGGEIRMHPGGNTNSAAAAVLGWKNLSAGTETVNVSFSLADLDASVYSFSDGIEYWLFDSAAASGVYLKHGIMDNGGSTGTITTDAPVSVASGGMLYLQIGPRTYIDCDMTAVTCSITTIPEPSALLLMITSMIGLLAYAWRKRK